MTGTTGQGMSLGGVRPVQHLDRFRRICFELGLSDSVFIEIMSDSSMPIRARRVALALVAFRSLPRRLVPRQVSAVSESDDTVVLLVGLVACTMLTSREQLAAYGHRYPIVRIMPSRSSARRAIEVTHRAIMSLVSEQADVMYPLSWRCDECGGRSG